MTDEQTEHICQTLIILAVIACVFHACNSDIQHQRNIELKTLELKKKEAK